MQSIYSILQRQLKPVMLFVLMTASLVSYAAPPTTPLEFRFEGYSDTTAELFWLRSSGSPIVTGYELTKNGEVLGVFDALSYVDTTLTRDVPYEFSITAINSQGERSPTISITVRVPGSFNQIESLQQEVAELRALLSQNAPAPVAATGETISQQFGDDGSARIGVSVPGDRFTDNNDGTFTDRLTGITWLAIRECIIKHDWFGAIDYANSMADDGVTCPALSDGSVAGDWRLPTIRELQSLMDFTKIYSAFADGIPYQGNWSENPWTNYWSSTSFGPAPDTNGWYFHPEYGYTAFQQKTGAGYSWPVKY